MKRKVLIATNNNPDYFFYIPIVEWVWNILGWELILFKTDDCNDVLVNSETTDICIIPNIDNVRKSTLAQVVRFFATDVIKENCLLQIQDIDVIPLQNFWQPNENEISIYGWDTTGYGFIPIHYATMQRDEWYNMMECTGNLVADMEREMKTNERAYSGEWERYWFTDWDIFTNKCNKVKDKIKFTDRGMVHVAKDPTALGRVDRYDYSKTLHQKNLIDIHAYNGGVSRPENTDIIKHCLIKAYGKYPEWYDSYVKDFRYKYSK